jgi:FkbM family methyltransferase
MGIDFLLYVFKEKPRLDLEIFDEHDRKEIMKFVKNKVYCALSSAVEKSQLFDEEDLSFWRKYDVLVKNVKGLKNHLVLTWKGKERKLPLNYGIDIAVFFHRCGIDELSPVITAQVEGKDIIDGGAFVGDSMLILSELKPRRIYAFEPSSQNKTIHCLRKRYVLMRCQMRCWKNALALREGRTRMYPYGVGSFVSEIYGRPKGEEVEVVSIDEFAKENALEVGLIKLDVEGSEYDVIAGARETIKTFRPILIVCPYHRGKDFFETPKLVKELVPEYKLCFLCVNRHHLTFDRVLLSYVD